MDSQQVSYSSSFEETTNSTATKTRSIDCAEVKTVSEALSRAHQSESDTVSFSKSDNISRDFDLSPWEKWLVSKVSKKREEILAKDAEHQMKRMEDFKINREKLQKQQLCDLKYKAWLASKNAELNRRKVQHEREAESNRKLDETKRAEAQEKSQREFKKWIKHKIKDKNEKETLLREKAQGDIRHQDEKRTLNEAEYSKWLLKASKMSFPEYRCFGYTSGKLISWKC